MEDFENMSIEHGSTKEDTECKICYDNINKENYVEYATSKTSSWYPAKFCLECINSLQDTQFHRYVELLSRVDCAREQRALLERGPPINLYDEHGFPEAGKKEIYAIWIANKNKIASAKLKDSLVGEERLKYWEEQKTFIINNFSESDENEIKDEETIKAEEITEKKS